MWVKAMLAKKTVGEQLQWVNNYIGWMIWWVNNKSGWTCMWVNMHIAHGWKLCGWKLCWPKKQWLNNYSGWTVTVSERYGGWIIIVGEHVCGWTWLWVKTILNKKTVGEHGCGSKRCGWMSKWVNAPGMIFACPASWQCPLYLFPFSMVVAIVRVTKVDISS